MKINICRWITAAFCVIMLAGCGQKAPKTTADLIFRFYRSSSGDAKLIREDYLLTTINRKLVGIDLSTGKVSDLGISCDWLSVIPEDGVILYSNADCELGACVLDSYNKISQNNILFTNTEADYMIDPAIEKAGGSYYISMTFVDGRLNNANAKRANGQYTIRFYKSDDLKKLTYLSDVVSANRNLEDIKLTVTNEKMYMFFEKETLDQGSSAIQMAVSEDMGRHWNSPVTVLPSDADQEPAGLLRTDDGWQLYYSSDVDNPGESYNGACAYRTHLDRDMGVVSKNERLELATPDESDPETDQKGGILLYDVQKFGSCIYFVYSEDHLSSDNLCVSVLETGE